MKIVPLLIILYIALVGIVIFDNVDSPGWGANPYTDVTSTTDIPESAIWELFTDPTNWKSNAFIGFITITFLAAAAAIVIAVITKSDILLLTPLFVVLINAGILPIIAIYQVVYREILRMTCTGEYNVGTLLATCTGAGTTGATAAILLSSIFVGPIALAWALACIEWWTQRPTS